MEGARRPTETCFGFKIVAGEGRTTKNGWGGEEWRVREREMGGGAKGLLRRTPAHTTVVSVVCSMSKLPSHHRPWPSRSRPACHAEPSVYQGCSLGHGGPPWVHPGIGEGLAGPRGGIRHGCEPGPGHAAGAGGSLSASPGVARTYANHLQGSQASAGNL